MNAHYTKFETQKQYNTLAKKAVELADVYDYREGNISFGYDYDYEKFVSYSCFENRIEDEEYYYQSATYLPYEQYLEYLDRCIKDKEADV